MDPLVSIIVPCHNAASYIAATLQSALQQTWTRVEVIVVDDASTDDSLAIAKSFEGQRCRVASLEQRGGAGAARNAGLAMARGDFVQFLDADDVLHPRKIECQLARLTLPENDRCVATGRYVRFVRDIADGKNEHLPIYTDLDPVEWLVTSWQGGGSMHSAGWLLPAGIAREAGPWMTCLCPNDDGDYFARAVLRSHRVLHCDAAISYYRVPRPSSLASNRSRAAMEGLLESLLLGAYRLLEAEDSPRTRKAAAIPLRLFSYMNYPGSRDLVSTAEQRIAELGGAYYPYQGSAPAAVVAHIAGWKVACCVERVIARLRSARAGVGSVLGAVTATMRGHAR